MTKEEQVIDALFGLSYFFTNDIEIPEELIVAFLKLLNDVYDDKKTEIQCFKENNK